MKLVKNKIMLTAVAAVSLALLFASFIVLTSFTSKVGMNNLSVNNSSYNVSREDGVNVAAVKANIKSPAVENEEFLNSVTKNLDEHVQKAKIQPAVKGSTGETKTNVDTQPPVQTANLNGYEQQVLALINQIRAANGLGALAPNQALTNIARSRSADMLNKNYFSHYSPEGTSVFDLLKANGISYRNAGENLAHSKPASAGSPQVFADAWMNSPTHKANILRDAYGQIGIGIAENNGRRVVTTVFMN
ncbi:MAG: CAP domain-containing protein [Actinomycetota bacterium]